MIRSANPLVRLILFPPIGRKDIELIDEPALHMDSNDIALGMTAKSADSPTRKLDMKLGLDIASKQLGVLGHLTGDAGMSVVESENEFALNEIVVRSTLFTELLGQTAHDSIVDGKIGFFANLHIEANDDGHRLVNAKAVIIGIRLNGSHKIPPNKW